MKSDEIVKSLKRLRVQTGSLACMGCGREHDCGVHGCAIMRQAADLIERLEKEKAALIDAANTRKLCGICKNDSWCTEHGCNGNLCEACSSYSACPCSNCLTSQKWEWKGLGQKAPEVKWALEDRNGNEKRKPV